MASEKSQTNGHAATNGAAVADPPIKKATTGTAIKTRVEQLETGIEELQTQLRELTAGYAQLQAVLKKLITTQTVNALRPSVEATLQKQVENKLNTEGLGAFLSNPAS